MTVELYSAQVLAAIVAVQMPNIFCRLIFLTFASECSGRKAHTEL